MSKRVGILGSGVVGKTLAAGFKKHGYDVKIASRDGSGLADFSQQSGVATGSFADVAAWAEIIVLAVKGNVAESACKGAGLANLAGKIVIDTTNPIADLPPVNGVLQYYTGPNDSNMERLQAAVPEARFVKAFSCVGNAFMVDPKFPGGPPTMFICGNDTAAKAEVGAILGKFGWEIADMGGVEGARGIEPLCILWCIPGLRGGPWTHAFKLLKLA